MRKHFIMWTGRHESQGQVTRPQCPNLLKLGHHVTRGSVRASTGPAASGCPAPPEPLLETSSVAHSAGIVVVVVDTGNYRLACTLNTEVFGRCTVFYSEESGNDGASCRDPVIQNAMHFEAVHTKHSEWIVRHQGVGKY